MGAGELRAKILSLAAPDEADIVHLIVLPSSWGGGLEQSFPPLDRTRTATPRQARDLGTGHPVEQQQPFFHPRCQ